MSKALSQPRFNSPFGGDDRRIAEVLLGAARLPPEREPGVAALAGRLIEAIRGKRVGLGGVEDLLREYALSTKEGLALMVLAEALLRVPDAATADRLIEDKLGQGDFQHRDAKSDAFLINASAWALGISARVVAPGESLESVLGLAAKRLGRPAVRAATRQAMRIVGEQFVLGETIDSALRRTRSKKARLYRYSFDMLGEGARTAKAAGHHFAAYASAIDAIGQSAGEAALPNRPGISVKLSALHPRYDALSAKRVLAELTPQLKTLALQAKSYDLNFTVDAEEADRLELSLDVIQAVFSDSELSGWDGFGLAVQAYQKRAMAVIDWCADLAERFDRRMMIRLVKGAYWDTEVKRAQERGLEDYPVFTRKAMTDLNFMACADRLLALRPRIFPQFATHNAHSVAWIVERAGGVENFEFQRLHGMGEVLYERLFQEFPGAACRTYAPVGEQRELLAYLVRRLLENGANSSFVSMAGDPSVPLERLTRHPADIIGPSKAARHPRMPLPRDLYLPHRKNSMGVELGHRASLEALLSEMRRHGQAEVKAASIIDGKVVAKSYRQLLSPIDGATASGLLADPELEDADRAVAAAIAGSRAWSDTDAGTRAAALDRAAERIEAERARLIHLLQVEAGKTLDDAISEVREAADFCRYYAAEGRALFGEARPLPGPTGESNRLQLRGRGVFVAISPWNFPLAIFVGQVAAALVAGNAVVAKPAEQTPLIAAEAVRILHDSGVARTALQFLPGDGAIGARLVEHPAIAGVVFTGSTEVARSINRALAAKAGPIVPLIAETGGINAMIVDATALPEQVTDDVVASAFRSAGQRCSALRLLCLQKDVADQMIDMILGAVRELKTGDPRDLATQVGPVIDLEAKTRLTSYISTLAGKPGARLHYAGEAPAEGSYFAPHIVELDSPEALTEEVFGPVLHVLRYEAADLLETLAAVERKGYGLTFGIHSRIDSTIDRVVKRLSIGNVYVNRNIIGAVVGTQPFGGHGLSGTGPKAGGPHYLPRFAVEQTITVNTAAVGGNMALMSLEE